MKHLFNGISVYVTMLYGTYCKYSTCLGGGDICGLKWPGEVSLKNLDLTWVFKDGLDLNWLRVWKETALSGKKKMSRSKRGYQECEAPWAVKSSLHM